MLQSLLSACPCVLYPHLILLSCALQGVSYRSGDDCMPIRVFLLYCVGPLVVELTVIDAHPSRDTVGEKKLKWRCLSTYLIG